MPWDPCLIDISAAFEGYNDNLPPGSRSVDWIAAQREQWTTESTALGRLQRLQEVHRSFWRREWLARGGAPEDMPAVSFSATYVPEDDVTLFSSELAVPEVAADNAHTSEERFEARQNPASSSDFDPERWL